MSAITELARAKINLTLKVRGRRPDGYHEIESLIAFAADLGDSVRLTPGPTTSLHVCGPFAAAITGKNLIESALARLADAEPRLVVGGLALDKRLPVAAGIGGGSADAAAVLRAVRRANPKPAERVDWAAIAAALGADVPVCLESRPALVWGKGEKVTAVPNLPRLRAVLVNPLADVPADKTARVFAKLNAPPAAPEQTAPSAPTLTDTAALLAYMSARGNDLMAAAIAAVPQIASVRSGLAACPGCQFVGLSGAGPTCFAIFETAAAASAAEDRLRAAHPRWWVAATALGG